jgi:transcription initiation factor TFIID subunit 6
MSHLNNETIESILKSSMTEPPLIEPRASDILGAHVEARLRQIIQESKKFAIHGKRSKVRSSDVAAALRVHGLKPVLGYASNSKVKFVKVGEKTFKKSSRDQFKTRLTELAREVKAKQDDQKEYKGGQLAFDLDNLDEKSNVIKTCFQSMNKGYPLGTLRQKLVEAGVENLPSLVPQNLYVRRDRKVNILNLTNEFLPSYPLNPSLRVHWLAVNGVQPCIPENDSADFKDMVSKPGHLIVKKTQDEEEIVSSERIGGYVQVKTMMKHTLSEEQAKYFESITKALLFEEDSNSSIKTSAVTTRAIALQSLSRDNGLQQLVPYISKFVTDNSLRLLKTRPRPSNLLLCLESMVLAVSSLLSNSHVNIEFYAHQLMPVILSILLNKKICKNRDEPHWDVRELAARTVAEVCQMFGDKYPDLQTRITETYIEAMRKSSSNLSTHFGAIVGTYWLGPLVVESVLMSLHNQYVELLEKRIEEYSKSSESSKNVAIGTEACSRCRFALNRAIGTLLQYKIKHHSRFSKSKDLKSQIDSLSKGTSPLNEEKMLPFLQQSGAGLFSTNIGEMLL